MEPLDKITVKDYFRGYDLNRISYSRATVTNRALALNDPLPNYWRPDGTRDAHLLLINIYTLTNQAITRLAPIDQQIINAYYRDQLYTPEAMEAVGITSRAVWYRLSNHARKELAATLNDLLAKHKIPLLILP